MTKTAYFYGDSLTYESRPTIRSRFTGTWTANVTAFPGQGPCVLRAALERDLQTVHPTVVTIQSHGGLCGPATWGSPEHYASFRSDLHAMFTAARASGAKVVYVVTPPETIGANIGVEAQLTAIAVDEAAADGVKVTYAPRNSVGGTTFKATMRCLAVETAVMGCDGGQIAVRSPDRLHFCPDPAWNPYVGGCSVYASGAFRYGRAIATAAKNA